VFAFLFLSIPHDIKYPLTCLGRNEPKPQPESPVSPHERKTLLTLHGKVYSGLSIIFHKQLPILFVHTCAKAETHAGEYKKHITSGLALFNLN